jgi:hypothetical protein
MVQSISSPPQGEARKGLHGANVLNYSAFGERNESCVTLPSSRNAASLLPSRIIARQSARLCAVNSKSAHSASIFGTLSSELSRHGFRMTSPADTEFISVWVFEFEKLSPSQAHWFSDIHIVRFELL